MKRLATPRSPLDTIDWDKNNGLVPVVVHDVATWRPLMLGYANREALEKTLETGYAHFYSRSRRQLWMKGETSGNKLKIARVEYDCDSDTLLYLAEPTGPVCHTGEYSCFHNVLQDRLVELMWQRIISEFKKARIARRPGKRGLKEYLYIVNPLTDNIPPPHPATTGLIAEYLAAKTPAGIDKTVTIEALGLPIATLVAQRLGLPLAIVRERAFPARGWTEPFQSGYKEGTHYIYGLEPGEQVILVDDAVSTGGAAESVIKALEKHEVTVKALLVMIAKPQYGGVDLIQSMGIPVHRAVDVYIEDDNTLRLVQPETGLKHYIRLPGS